MRIPVECTKLPKCLRLLMVGESNSGKSTLTLKLLSEIHRYFPEDFKRILYVWPHKSEASLSDKQFLSEMAKVHPRITILYRMPTVKDLISCFRLNERTLVVLDDCDDLAFNDPFIARIFSQHANHASCNIMLLTTACTRPMNSRYYSQIIKNTNTFIVFESPHRRFISTLNTLLFTYYRKFLTYCLDQLHTVKNNVKRPFLLINLDIHNNPLVRDYPVCLNWLQQKEQIWIRKRAISTY